MPNIDMRTVLHIAGELVLFAGVSYYFQVRTRILGTQIKELQKIVEAQNQSIMMLQQQVNMLMMQGAVGAPVQAPVVVPVPVQTPSRPPVQIPITRRPVARIVEEESESETIQSRPAPPTVAETTPEDLDKELSEELGELEASKKD